MRVILACMASALALAIATPANAQPYRDDYRGEYRGDHRRGEPGAWRNINARQAALNRRIDRGIRDGTLTRREAVSLRREFRDIARQEAYFRRTGGLSYREREALDDRFDRLARRIRWERQDWAYRY